MKPLPPRVTRAELAVNRLREAIASGEWRDRLPAERELSRALEVSRETLRLALDQLKREGWIFVEGKRTRVRRVPSARGQDTMRTRRIVFLSPLALELLPTQALILYGELARRLAALDASIHLATSPAFTHQDVDRYLDSMADKLNADGWILHRAPLEVQRYFQERALPAVLFGNAHPGIELPALQVDYPAALRHCFAALRRAGHAPEQIALVVPETELAGNLELEAAFRESIRVSADLSRPPPCMIRHHESGGNLAGHLDRALLRQPRPTAFIVLRTSIAATLHGLLSYRAALRLPDDVSLACLEDAPFMKNLVPRISRYHVDNGKIVRLVFSLLSRQLSSGLSRSWRHRPLIPEFVPGETMGAAPPAKR